MLVNEVVINDSRTLMWYVGDQKMDKLIEYLDKIGHRGGKPYKYSPKSDEENQKLSKEYGINFSNE